MKPKNPVGIASAQVDGRLAYDLAQLRAVVPFGRSYVYEQIKLGRLRACKAGKRTIITRAALTEFLDLLEREAPFAGPEGGAT